MTLLFHRILAARRRAFTLLEVVIALAMLAVIAVPAIGLATMAVSRSKQQMVASEATELKNRVDVAIRALEEGPFDLDIDSSKYLMLFASADLRYIEREGDLTGATAEDSGNDKYYKIEVRNPINYTYSTEDRYRLVQYYVSWPNNDLAREQKQLFFLSVFRK